MSCQASPQREGLEGDAWRGTQWHTDMDGDDDYTAVFPVDRPLGINLADVNDRCMVQWVPRGHRAKPGSLLISVNGQSVQHHGFIDTMQMLARAQFPLSLAFRAAPSAHSPIELRVGESGAWEKLHGTLSNGVLRCASSKRSGASADTGAGVVGGTGWDETTVAVEDGGSARLRIPLRGLECTVERRAGQRAVTLLRVPAASASPRSFARASSQTCRRSARRCVRCG